MIRSEVMAWAAILLVIVFAFVLIPVHERFVDAQGRYTDVSPNAPPRPSWMSGPTTGSLVSASDVRPVDTSTAYSRTAPPIRPLGAPTSNMPSAPVGVGVGTVATPSSACWELADSTAGKFIDWRVYLDFMTQISPKLEACTRGSPPPATGPTAAQKACFANAGMYFSLEEAQTACASDSACKAVVGGAPGPVTNYTKFNGDAKIVTLDLTPGAVPPGLIGTKAYVKKPCGGSTNLSLLPSPTAPAPRISSTLGVGDPSLSGMNASYTSGIRPPSGSPWEGLQGLTEMASVPTDPFFNAQTRPTPPLGNLRPTEPDMGLFGPGPNVLRKNLVGCTCASQAAGCSVHPRR